MRRLQALLCPFPERRSTTRGSSRHDHRFSEGNQVVAYPAECGFARIFLVFIVPAVLCSLLMPSGSGIGHITPFSAFRRRILHRRWRSRVRCGVLLPRGGGGGGGGVGNTRRNCLPRIDARQCVKGFQISPLVGNGNSPPGSRLGFLGSHESGLQLLFELIRIAANVW